MKGKGDVKTYVLERRPVNLDPINEEDIGIDSIQEYGNQALISDRVLF